MKHSKRYFTSFVIICSIASFWGPSICAPFKSQSLRLRLICSGIANRLAVVASFGSLAVETSACVAQLRWFYLESDMQGHGIGKKLLQETISYAKTHGYKHLVLWSVDKLKKNSKTIPKSWLLYNRTTDDYCRE